MLSTANGINRHVLITLRMHGPYELDGLVYEESQGVYPFREDSLLLFQAIQPLLKGFRGVFLDMGCGTGLNGMAAAREGWAVLAVDREPKALALSRGNLALNGLKAEMVLSDLLEGVPGRWLGQVDLAAFNPPYLEPFGELLEREELPLSGRGSPLSLTRRFLDEVASFLGRDGRAMVLVPHTWGDSELALGTNLEPASRTAMEVRSSGERFDLLSLIRRSLSYE